MMTRRFPQPWTIDDNGTCFIVKGRGGQELAHVYYGDELGRCAAAGQLTRDEARRIAMNVLKLPELPPAKSDQPLTFDRDSEYFGATETLDRLARELPRAAEISDRYQLAQLVRAGRAIIGAPRSDQTLIDILLVRPLNEILAHTLSINIEGDAKIVLHWLSQKLSQKAVKHLSVSD
jgi:hypothetical protein